MSNFGRSLFTVPRNLLTRKINTMSNIESQTITPDPSYLEKTDGARIAYHRLAGRSPGIIFFGGFASDMTGTKAMAIESYARNRGQAFCDLITRDTANRLENFLMEQLALGYPTVLLS